MTGFPSRSPHHLSEEAYALPYRRFACTFTGTCARLGADAVRYSFIVADFHRLLLAGFTGAQKVCQEPTLQRSRTSPNKSLVALLAKCH
jgi:hypothetical protein